MAVVVQRVQVVAGARPPAGARQEREQPELPESGGDRPAGFRLPPVVHHRLLQNLLRPDGSWGVAALARQIQSFQRGQVVLREELAFRVLLLDGAHRGGRGEQHLYPMLGADPPEGAGIGGADRLALIHDGRAAPQQRRVDDIAVPHDPADVGGCPVHIPRIHAVEHLHGVPQRHRVPAIVAHHALGPAGGAGGVENIERVGRLHRHAVVRFGGGFGLQQVVVAALCQLARRLLALQDQAGIRLVRRQADRGVQQGFVFDDPPRLQPAGRGDHHPRLGIRDAGRQFGRREASEHDRVHSPKPSAGEHADGGFGDHGHVEDDAVAFDDPELGQRAGQLRHARLQVAIGKSLELPGHRAVPDQRRLVAAPASDVPVETIETGVQLAAREPLAIGAQAGIEHRVPASGPVDALGRRGPPGMRVGLPLAIGFVVQRGIAHRGVSSLGLCGSVVPPGQGCGQAEALAR